MSNANLGSNFDDFLRSEGILGEVEAGAVIKLATCVAGGDVERALRWYRSEPLAPFGGKTPEQLVVEGRVGDLIPYIESLHAGAAG